MKLLVSKRTKTLVPTKASGRSMPGRASLLPSTIGLVEPSSATCSGGFGAFGEGGDLLEDAVLVDLEVVRLQAVDVVPLIVGDLEAQHHHVHFDAEHGAGCILGAK